MKDNGTTRLTFNLDTTPEIDIAGDLYLDPSTKRVFTHGMNASYFGHLGYANYAVAGTQGWGDTIGVFMFIPHTAFQADRPQFAAWSPLGLEAGKDFNATVSYIIPAGWQVTRGVVIDNGASLPYYVYSGNFCSKTLRIDEQASKVCPDEFSPEGWAVHMYDWTPVAGFFKGDVPGNSCTITVKVKNKQIVYGAALYLTQL